MIQVRQGGGKKLPPHMQRTVKKPRSVKPEDVVDDEYDGGEVVKRKRSTTQSRIKDATELPRWIKVSADFAGISEVPARVRSLSPFKWDPQAFTLENERLKDKLIESELQDQSLRRWIDDPTLPVVYGVSGSPDDMQARYFAAYLAQVHAKALGSKARILWQTLYSGRDKTLEDYRSGDSMYEPTLLVLTNLSRDSTPYRLENARDWLERFSTIPRIVVAAGEDPMSFLSARLHSPCNGIAYFSADLMRRKVEVI